MIKLEEVTKKYRISKDRDFTALKGINLSINQGVFVAITGKSGAGKSTLLHIIGCIDNVSGGRYELDGRDISSLGDAKLSEIRNSYFRLCPAGFRAYKRNDGCRKHNDTRVFLKTSDARHIGEGNSAFNRGRLARNGK